MGRENFEEMLDYYQQEMTYLLQAGKLFADQYPRVAANLGISYTGSSDPHVQRLLESFAFLTARLQKEVDEKFIRFTHVLLGTLYPQFVTPFPSCSVAQFTLSPHLGKTSAGYNVPKGTQLYIEADEGQKCRFQTAYPTELWPIEVTQGTILSTDQLDMPQLSAISPWVLHLQIQRYDGVLHELPIESLRFHLFGDKLLTNFLLESLFASRKEGLPSVYIKADTSNNLELLHENSLQPVGFKDDENLLPYPSQALPAYRLLHEFFAFPEKFKFFDIKNLQTKGANRFLDIYIPLSEKIQTDRFRISKSNFVLGCTPIVNLFPKISEPLDLNYQSLSYRLVADQRGENTNEIHSITKVMGIREGAAKTDIYAPFFSYDHEMEENKQSLFWYSESKPSPQDMFQKTETFLSFVDFDFSPHKPAHQTVYAHVLCTNKNLTVHIPAGAKLQADSLIPPATITCLDRPTVPLEAAINAGGQWQLISQLSLNHLSLSGGNKALSSLKELLNLYANINKLVAHPEINFLQEMSVRPITGRIGREAWRGFVQGLNINLTTSAVPFSGDNTFLLGMVLNEFFRLYTNINSFTQLSLVSTQGIGIWKQWPAQIGSQQIL